MDATTDARDRFRLRLDTAHNLTLNHPEKAERAFLRVTANPSAALTDRSFKLKGPYRRAAAAALRRLPALEALPLLPAPVARAAPLA